MSDDKTKRGHDRVFVAGGEEYEVRHFADKHGISVEQVENLIEQYGNSREKLEKAVRALKG